MAVCDLDDVLNIPNTRGHGEL